MTDDRESLFRNKWRTQTQNAQAMFDRKAAGEKAALATTEFNLSVLNEVLANQEFMIAEVELSQYLLAHPETSSIS
jgi:hypothetical protein